MTNIITNQYNVIGLMSGTSLDGLDIAFCKFIYENHKWSYEIICAETIHYSDEWRDKLNTTENNTPLGFHQIHIDYGFYLGHCVSDFIIKQNLKVDFISSHGHTVFHQPEKKLTVQIGSGSAIASICKLPVVCDFRSLDVALGGQGAPLVPIGDKILFNIYDYCLNLGGFANVSYENNNERIAYDICPANIVLNAICNKIGQSFDNNGDLAKEGMLSSYLLNELNQLGYYKSTLDSPKSMGKEWVIKNIYPLFELYELTENDLLNTYCNHIAFQISKSLNGKPKGKMLITGGGAYNTFLMDCIKNEVKHQIIIPDKKTIEYKEAMIFAFLGVLRMRNEINCLKSVTGASIDNIGGSVYHVN